MAGPVLLVEPDDPARRSLARVLRRAYFVTDAVDRLEPGRLPALAAAADLVLLPATEAGRLALETLRRSAVGWTLPVVIHAPGPLDEAAQVAWLAAGADDVLPEAAANPILACRLAALIRYKRGNDRLSQTLAGFCMAADPLARAPGRGAEPEPESPVIVFDPARTAQGWQPPVPGACLVTGEAALLERLRAVPEARVLMALATPAAAETGLRLIPQICADAARRFLPLVLHLAPGQEAVAQRALELGASDVVIGPASGALLAARLSACDRRRRRAAQVQASVLEQMRLATIDPLTGLRNRRYAESQGPVALAQAAEAGQPFALIMVDIDRFKAINDRFGHPCGDRVIMIVARRIARAVRAADIVARIGGEEFLVILPDTGAQTAQATAARIRDAIAGRPVRTGQPGEAIAVTVSAGVAVIGPGEPASFDAALALADRALYSSKASGRDRVSLSLGGTAA